MPALCAMFLRVQIQGMWPKKSEQWCKKQNLKRIIEKKQKTFTEIRNNTTTKLIFKKETYSECLINEVSWVRGIFFFSGQLLNLEFVSEPDTTSINRRSSSKGIFKSLW